MERIKPTLAIRSLEIGQTASAPITQKNSIRAIIQTNEELKLGLWKTKKSGERLLIERINLPLTDNQLEVIESKIKDLIEGEKKDSISLDFDARNKHISGEVTLSFKEIKDEGTHDTAPYDSCELESWRFSGTVIVLDEKYNTTITNQKIRF